MIIGIKKLLLNLGIGKKEIMLIGLILVGFFLFIAFNNRKLNKKKNDLNKSFRYTVCITVGKVKNIRSSGPDLNYRFRINGIIYEGSRRFKDDGNINYNGGRYFVKFQPENPSNSIILLECPVPSEIAASDTGWVQLPISCPNANY